MRTATSEREIELARTDRVTLVGELESCGARFLTNGKECCCPFHEDRNPSAGIFRDEGDGSWRFKCFACGEKAMDVFDVRSRRTGKPAADLMRDFLRERNAEPVRQSEATFAAAKAVRVYADETALGRAACWQGKDEPPLFLQQMHKYTSPKTGQPDLIVFRLYKPDGSKTFRQASPVEGGWQLKGPQGKWPIYNRSRLHWSSVAIVVEGEKAVEAITPALPDGWAATTNAGGAETGKAILADWSPLAGKMCYLWPDNDPPDEKRGGKRTGLLHMEGVAAELAKLVPACEVHWIDPDKLGLPPKGDAADWVAAKRAAGVPADRLADALDAEVLTHATPIRPSGELARHYADIAAGRLRPVAWPWPHLSRLTQSLQPGTITVVCGDAGAGKSWLMTEAVWTWLHAGERVACLMLESGATFHAKRLHAVLANEPNLLDMEWVAANGDRAAELYRQCAGDLDVFWRALDVSDDPAAITAAYCLDWLKRRLAAGCRVAVIDPVSAISGDKPWVTDKDFLHPARDMANKAGASLVLVTHPDRGGKNMAGSEAFKRFVDTVLWFHRHDHPRHDRVMVNGFAMPSQFNRTARIRKARLGRGAGFEIAYRFGDGLRFSEVGVIAAADSASTTEGQD